MRFVTPSWLWLLVLPVLLLLAVLLAERFRTMVVSSVNLWRTREDSSFASRPRYSLPIRLDTLIALLALVLLALAATGPWLSSEPPCPALAVVLDVSPSMGVRSGSGGQARIDLGFEAALAALRSGRLAAHRSLLIAGATPYAVHAGPGLMKPFEDALRGIEPTGGAPALAGTVDAAVTVVRSRGGGRVIVVSDFAGAGDEIVDRDDDGVAIEIVPVGSPAPNHALTSLHVSPRTEPPGGLEVVATLMSTFPPGSGTTLYVSLDGRVLEEAELRVEPGVLRTARFRLPDVTEGFLEVTLEPGGALSEDDSLRTSLSRTRIIEGPTAVGMAPELAAAVAAIRATPILQRTPSRTVSLITGEMIGEPPSRWIRVPRGTGTSSVQGRNAPEVAVEPLGYGRDLLDPYFPLLVSPRALPPSPPPEGASILALAGGRPVLAFVEREEGRGLWWGVPLEATDLVHTGTLPLLLSDMVEFVAGSAASFRRGSVPVEDPDLTPRPNETMLVEGSRVTADPVPLRGALLWASIILALCLGIHGIGERSRAANVARLVVSTVLALVLLGSILGSFCRTGTGPGAVALVVDEAGSTESGERSESRARLAVMLQALPRDTRVTEFPNDGSAEPVRAAIRSIRAEGDGSILVVSDGRRLSADASALATEASNAGAVIHVAPLPVVGEGEAAIESLQVPRILKRGETYEPVVLVRSTVEQRLKVEIRQDATAPVSRVVTVEPRALHAVRFLEKAGSLPGTIVARIEAEVDGDPGNNRARAHLQGSGSTSLASVGCSALPGLPGNDRWDRLPTPGSRITHDAILACMTESSLRSESAQRRLADHARRGHGLVVILDDPLTAASLRGGTLEGILPARLVPPDRHQRDTSLVVLVDRSGSMDDADAASTPLGLAMDAAASIGALLSEEDRLGLIAFDVGAHVIRPLGPVSDLPGVTMAIPAIAPEGGTDWTAAIELAAGWLGPDPAAIRHVILVSDGQLAPGVTGMPSGAWPADVTLSTVAIGDGSGTDRLRELARRFGGRFERVTGPGDLPAALRKECALLGMPEQLSVRGRVRSETDFRTLHEELSIAPGGRLLSVTAKPGAEIALSTEQGEPILSFGRAGWGRVALLGMNPGSLVRTATGADASASILGAALARVAGSGWDPPDRTRMHHHRGTMVFEHVLEDPVSLPPPVKVRFPSGRSEIVNLARISVDRARGSLDVAEEGEYVLEAGGSQWRHLLEPAPARASLVYDPDWAERLASGGGGTVISLDRGSSGAVPPVERSRRMVDAAPMLIAFAASLLFVDSVLQCRRPHGVRPEG